MKNIGWLPLTRKIQNHWIWDDKPFSKGQAWIDLLLLASHDKTKFLLGNELLSLPMGSLVTSELKLMQRWGWGKGRTRAFLSLLEKDNMIKKQTDRKKTVIKIVNYKVYNDFEFKNIPQTDNCRTTVGQLSDTNNNLNNEKQVFLNRTEPKFEKALQDFCEYRKKIKKPLTEKGVNLICKKLDGLSSDINEQIEILNNTIANGWVSVYPLKKNDNNVPCDFGSFDVKAFEASLNND